MKRKKQKKQKRFMALLLAMLLVLNVFLPAGSISSIAGNEAAPEALEMDTGKTEDPITPESPIVPENPTTPDAPIEGEPTNPETPDEGEPAKPTDPAGGESTDPSTENNVDKGNNDVTTVPVQIGLFDTPVVLDAPARSHDLTNMKELVGEIEIVVKKSKDGAELDHITPGTSFYVEGTFNAYSHGDDDAAEEDGKEINDWIKEGDYVLWPLDKNIRPATVQLMKVINGKNEKIADVHFGFTGEDGNNYAKIVFTNIFEDIGVNGGLVKFGADLTYNDESGSIDEVGTTIIILGNTVTIKAEKKDPVPKVTKVGTQNGDIVDWQATVNVTKNDKDISLEGYTFTDHLSESTSGNYVGGSFKLDGNKVTGYDADNINTLTYTFNSDETGERVFTYSTKVPESQMLGGSVNNNATFGDGEFSDDDSITVPIATITVITKTGNSSYDSTTTEDYNPNDETITWTIKITPGDIKMKSVQVTDIIDPSKGLVWQGAHWKWENSSSTDSFTPPTIDSEPAGGVYELGNGETPLTKNIELIIVTKVTNPASVSQTDFRSNSAKLVWDGYSRGKEVGSGDVGVGIDVLNKTAGNINYLTRQIPWTITFNAKGQSSYPVATSKIYDLFLYEDTTNTSDYTSTGATSEVLTKLLAKANKGQRIVAGSNTDDGGVKSDIYPVLSGTKRVGDLLVISDLAATNGNQTVTFRTEVLDPAVFAGNNSSKQVDNAAYLYNGATELDDGKAHVNYDGRVLDKSRIGNFDYTNNTAVFQLSINPKSLNLNETVIGVDDQNADIKLGNVKVIDQLPAGWEFYNFDSGSVFEIYNTDSSGNATGIKLNLSSDDLEQTFETIDGRKAIVFNFKKLEQRYAIKIKAQITDAQYQKLLEDAYSNPKNPAASKSEKNDSYMKADSAPKWKPTSNASVSVNTQVLTKAAPNFIKTNDHWTGELEWIVKYNPYNFDFLKKDQTQDGKITIVDTLGEGHSMIYSKITGLDYSTCKVWAYENPGGTIPARNDSYKVSEDDVKKMISYDPNTRTMTFTPLKSGVAYELQYRTYATNADLPSLDNSVALKVGEEKKTETEQSGQVNNQWADADLSFTGRIKITKYDGTPGKTKSPLPGVVFKLYDENKQNEIKTSKATDANGVTYIRAIPAPMSQEEGTYTYWLKETVPTGYLDEDKWYKVEVNMVETNGTSRPQTTVDGVKYADDNLEVVNKLVADVGSLEIKKTVNSNIEDEYQKDFAFTVKVAGAGTGFYSSNQGPIEFKNDTATVHLIGSSFIKITGLPKGAYEVEEAKQENCDTTYVNNKGVTSTVKGTGTIATGEENKVDVTNTKYELSVQKTDASGNGLSNAKLQLWKDGVIREEWTSEKNAKSFYNLPDGTYRLVETEAPAEYVLAKDIEFIVENGQPKLKGVNIRAITMIDAKKGQIIISKKAVTGSDELPGAKLELRRIGDGALIDKWTSGNTPHVIDYLPDGEYELTEITAPQGYLVAEKIKFTVVGGEADQQVTMYDAPVEISISKTDMTTGNELPGAELQLWKDGVLREKWISGTIPHKVYRLEDGTYELVEITAPYGYLIAEKIVFEVKDGKTAEPVVMKDAHAPSGGGGGGGNGGGPKTPKTPTPAPTPNPTEPAPTPEPVNPSEVPQGRVQGPDGNYYTPQQVYDIFGQVPLGYIVGPNGMLVPLGGLPKTGDDISRNTVIFGLLSITTLFGMAVSISVLKKKRSGK